MKKLVALLALAASPLAHAQADRGMYFGAGLGSFDYDAPDTETMPGISDSAYSYHLFGGYKFTDNFALEFGLSGTGDLERDVDVTVPQFGPLTLELDGNFDIYSLTAIGILPFDRFSLFAGAGYYSASLGGDVSVTGFGTVDYLDGRYRGAAAKIGIQRDFGLDLKSLSIRGHFDWYDFDDGVDANGFTVALLFRF